MPFRFLSLPAVIRNMIYRLLLVPNQAAVLSVHETPARPKFIPIWPLLYLPISNFDTHRIQYGVSLLHDPTVMLLNHQVRAEYSGIYSKSSKLLVGIWDKGEIPYSPSRIGKDFQRSLIRYMKSSKIFVNAGWESSKEIPTSNSTHYTLPPFELVHDELRETVGCLVAALKLMPRLETLEIIYVNSVKEKREFGDYDPKLG